MGWYDFDSENRKKLDAIERQHISDEACLKADLFKLVNNMIVYPDPPLHFKVIWYSST